MKIFERFWYDILAHLVMMLALLGGLAFWVYLIILLI